MYAPYYPPTANTPEWPSRQPVFEFNGEIHYVNTPEGIDWWCDYLRLSHVRLVGLDTEWKPEFRSGENNKIALIQICFRRGYWGYNIFHESNYVCLLFHVFISGVTLKLKSLLEDHNIIKAGVVLDQDIRKLWRHYGIDLRGFSDVDSDVHFRIYNRHGPSLGMSKLIDMVLGMNLRKSKTLAMSNWEAWSLSYNQQKYAATDAFACLRLYEALACTPPSMK